jgi:hypothetical protein
MDRNRIADLLGSHVPTLLDNCKTDADRADLLEKIKDAKAAYLRLLEVLGDGENGEFNGVSYRTYFSIGSGQKRAKRVKPSAKDIEAL